MIIKIVKINEKKDGNAIFNIEYDKDFENLVLKFYKRKKLTPKLLQRAIMDGLENYLKEQNEKNSCNE